MRAISFLKKCLLSTLLVSFSLIVACSADSAKVAALYKALPINTQGNSAGDITLVEFYDYRCGSCKKMAPILEQLTRSNNDLRIVLKPIAILGPDSALAAKAALAAKMQGRFLALNSLLINSSRPLNKTVIFEYAKNADLNIPRFQRDIDSQAVLAALNDNQNQAKLWDVQGTPTFFLGKTQATHLKPRKIVGARTLEDMNNYLAKER